MPCGAGDRPHEADLQLPMKLSHNPPGSNVAATHLTKRGALLGFIEDMKTTAVEDEVERAIGQRRGEKVQCRKATGQPSLFHFAVRPLDRERRDIDSKDIETALG